MCYYELPNREQYWNPHTLRYRFAAEARRALELEMLEPRLTTIHCALVLNIVSNLSGLHAVGQRFLFQACAMASKLGLFSTTPSRVFVQKERNARELSAWCLFNWQVYVVPFRAFQQFRGCCRALASKGQYEQHMKMDLVTLLPSRMSAYYFFRTPMFLHHPPSSLPDATTHQDWYGDVRVQYPGCSTVYSLHLGDTLKAFAGLRQIQSDFSFEFFAGNDRKVDLTIERAYFYNARAEDWRRGLSEAIKAEKLVYPHQFQPQYVSTMLAPPPQPNSKIVQSCS